MRNTVMKMKFWIIILPLVLSLFACNSKEKNNVVVFSGQIKNTSLDSVYVILNEREKGFALDFDGNFSDTIQLNDEGYKTFSIDREEYSLYLIPGDSLFFKTDLRKLEETFHFKGIGAERNNYLFEKDKLINEWFANESLFRLDADQYIQNIEDFTANLRKVMVDYHVDKSFEKIEARNLYFDEFNLLYTYRDSYAYFNPTKTQLPIDFLDFKRFDLDNDNDFKQFKSYRGIVTYFLDEKLNRGESPIDILKNIKSESIKYSFIRALIDDLDPSDEFSAITYQAIQKFCDHQPWLKEAKLIMDNRKK